MLSSLESQLAAALRQSLPSPTQVITGPPAAPDAATPQTVTVYAAGWHTIPDASEHPEGRREAAFLSRRVPLTGDGQTLDFPLQDPPGELAEVEWAPGRLARLGDQCWLERNLLRFYRPPEGPFTVVLRGGQAVGYRETATAAVRLALEACAAQGPVCDDLANTALAAVLSALVDVDMLTLAQVPAFGFGLRLLKPLMTVHGLERDAVETGAARLYRARFQLRLRGELELNLAQGGQPEVGRIERIEGRVEVPAAKASTSAAQASKD